MPKNSDNKSDNKSKKKDGPRRGEGRPSGDDRSGDRWRQIYRWHPERQYNKLRDYIGQFFDENLAEQFSWPEKSWRSFIDKRPRIDVSETDEEIKIVADVPGVDPDDMEIDAGADMIRISGTFKREPEETERPYRYERMSGSFSREIILPKSIDEKKVRASYKDGILTVTAPRLDKGGRNKIKIERG